MIRNATIEKTTGWNNYSGSATAATIYSILQVSAQPAISQVDGSGGNISDTDTFQLDALTFTFKNSPSVALEVAVGSSTEESIQNLSIAIHEASSDYLTEVSGDQLIIKTRTTGDGVTISTTPTLPWTTTDTAGNNGALVFEGEDFDISLDGAASVNVVLSGYTTANDASDIAATINLATAGMTASVAGTNRIQIVHDTAGATNTLEVTDASGTTLFDEGFYEGKTAQHPNSDIATTKIQLVDPSDPVYFRAINRPLVGLLANDREIYRELVALRDGYDIENGTEIASVNHLARFKASGGLHVDTDLHVFGDMILHGEPITQTAETLIVSDNTIILNYGETGSGVTDNGGVSGIIVDRGTQTDTYVRFNEQGTSIISGSTVPQWEIDQNITVPRISVEQSFDELSQITIGDGSTTFGHYEGTDLASSLVSAISDLPSGGKIYVKRGNYTWGTPVTLPTNNITIVGEGSATSVTVDMDTLSSEALNITANETLVTMIKFITDNGAASVDPVIQYTSGAQRNMLEKVWFIENGLDSVDITHVISDDNLLTNCISTTTTTNLP